MNTPKADQHILFIKGAHWEQGLSPEELQHALDRFMGWMEDLRTTGRLKVGQPLTMEGRIVSGRKDRVVSDGPFAESKEAIGGYFLLDVADFEEAVEIAKACPLIDYGASMDVRPVAQQCPIMEQLGIHLAHVEA